MYLFTIYVFHHPCTNHNCEASFQLSNTRLNSKHRWLSSTVIWHDTQLRPINHHPIKNARDIPWHLIGHLCWRLPHSSAILAANVQWMAPWMERRPKEIRWCGEIEAFKRNLKTTLLVKFVNESTLVIGIWIRIVKYTIMLMHVVEFVVLCKPCKSKARCAW